RVISASEIYFAHPEAANEPPCPGKGRRELPAKGDFSRPTSSALRGLIEAFFPANLYGGTSIYAQSQESTYISYAPSVKCSSLTLIILVMSQPLLTRLKCYLTILALLRYKRDHL